MSDQPTTPQRPGLRHQAGVRTALRVGGALVALAGLGLAVTAGVELFTLQGFETPHKFWMGIVGLPLLGVGLMMLQLGFSGAGARFAAGEYAPVVKDTAGYLSDGKGILGVGATGPYCRGCGIRNDAEARFCDSCGASLA